MTLKAGVVKCWSNGPITGTPVLPYSITPLYEPGQRANGQTG